MWSPPHFAGYGSPQLPTQWASAQWGSPNGGGFPPGMGYPMGGMMGMGYPMMPWANAYGMGEQPGSSQPYPSQTTPNIRSSFDYGMSSNLILIVRIHI
jgi:hypothetical protein